MKKVACFAVVLTSLFVWADEPVDLATYWAEPPTAAQQLPKGTYTLSADTEINVQLKSYPNTTFDFSSGKTFKTQGYFANYYNNTYKNSTNLYTGGTWDMKNGSIDLTGYWDLDWLSNHATIMDGFCMTNVNQVFGLYGAGKNVRWIMKNGSVMHATGLYHKLSSTGNGSDYHIDVLSGSKMIFTGGTVGLDYESAGHETDAVTEMTVSGEGSAVVAKASGLMVGNDNPNMHLRVTDGALVDAYYMRVGGDDYAHDCSVYIENAALTNSWYTYIGEQDFKYGATSNNSITAVNSSIQLGGTYNHTPAIGRWTPNNYLFISNSTLVADEALLGKMSTAATNNGLRVAGPKAILGLTLDYLAWAKNPWRPFGLGQHCWVQIEDGAQVGSDIARSDYWKWCVSYLDSTNELIRVKDAGTLFKPYDFVLNGCSNRLEVLDGATFNAYDLYSNETSYDCTLLVSNATVTTRGGGHIMMGGSGNHVVVMGTCPHFARTYKAIGVNIKDDTALDFYLPVGQADYDAPVFQYATLCVEDTASINFPNIEEFREGLERPTEVRLATRTQDGTFFADGISQAVMDATNAKLPKGCYMHVSADKTQLLLHVGSTRGLTVIVR